MACNIAKKAVESTSNALRKSAICSGTPRKGVLSGWRQRSKREKDRLRKAKEKKRRIRPHGGDAPDCKSAPSSAIMRSHKPLQKQRKDAVRKYSIHKVPGAHLTFDQRERGRICVIHHNPFPLWCGEFEMHGYFERADALTLCPVLRFDSSMDRATRRSQRSLNLL